MLNVIDFGEKAPRSGASRLRRQAAPANADISELFSRVGRLQTKVKAEIDGAILVLELAAQHGRQIAMSMCDPTVKKNFEERISTIERLLQAARDMALKL